MATVKIILRTQKVNTKGESPLYLRIIRHRKASFISLGIYVKEKDWDSAASKVKGTHRNSGRLNAKITQDLSEAYDTILAEEKKKKTISSRNLKAKILGSEPVDFFIYSSGYLRKLEASKKVGSYLRVSSIIEKLKTYCESKPLFLDDITPEFLANYEIFLKTKLKNGPNTVHGNMKVIRTIIRQAIQDGNLAVDDNPFLRFKMSQVPTNKPFLTEAELSTILGLDLSKSATMRHARDMFVFACYAGGIRISDMLRLQWRDINNGKVTIQTRKTGAFQSVKLTEIPMRILKEYQTKEAKPEDFVFPFFKDPKEVNTPYKLHLAISRKSSLVNKYLKEIGGKAELTKTISFHVSRHTFATLALTKGIPIEYVSKLMGHADIQETQVYAKIINEELDKAMGVFNK